MDDGRPARPAKRPQKHRGPYFCAAHVGAGVPPAQPSKARPRFRRKSRSITNGTKRKKQVPPLPSWFAQQYQLARSGWQISALKLPCHPERSITIRWRIVMRSRGTCF